VNNAKQKRIFKTGLIALATIMLAVLVTRTVASALQPHLYAGTVLRGDVAATPMTGIALASGQPADLGAYEDQVVLVYFGYTNCPDVCPTTLSTSSAAIAKLSSDQRERVQLIMVSVDPDRDDVSSLQEYVEFFNPTFLGATGSVEDIDRVTSLYGVFYELGEGSASDGYVVDHTATLMGIGTDGVLRVVWPPDISASELSGDLDELLK
jgi:protein SCO1/2